jgi:hypothetical protein
MSETIEVCPWTISVSQPITSGLAQEEPYVAVNVCNQLSGHALTCRASVGREADQLAEVIMQHVEQIEGPRSKAWCYLAWDKSADALREAMVSRGALFAPGYGVDVPIIVKRT